MSSRDVTYPERAEDYEVYGPPIGKGAFAKVYRAKVKTLNVYVALKILPLEDVTNLEDVRKEIMTMRRLRHANVVYVHTAFSVDENLWIIMPLLRGSIADAIKLQCPKGIKDEIMLATILKFCLQGLQYFHKEGLIHRDIKAGNVLVSDEGEVQLADFGVAGVLLEEGDRKEKRRTFTGTPCWMAPEVMENEHGYDCKADIWSFGILAMELAFGMAPYAQHAPMKVLMLTLQNDPPTIDLYEDKSHKFHKDFSDMLKLCLVKDPTKRKPAGDVLKHNFFKQAQDIEYIRSRFVVGIPAITANKVITSFKAEKAESKDDPVLFVYDAADLKEATQKIQQGQSVDLQPIARKAPAAPAAPAATAGAAAGTAAGPPKPPAAPLARVGSSRFLSVEEGEQGRRVSSPNDKDKAAVGNSRFVVVGGEQDGKQAPPKGPPPPPSGAGGDGRFVVK